MFRLVEKAVPARARSYQRAAEGGAQRIGQLHLPGLHGAYLGERQAQLAQALYFQQRIQIGLRVVAVAVFQPHGAEQPFGLVIAYPRPRQPGAPLDLLYVHGLASQDYIKV